MQARSRMAGLVLCAVVAGCGDDVSGGDPDGGPPPPVDGALDGDGNEVFPIDAGLGPDAPPPIPRFDEEGCPILYAQDRLPTFEIEIAPEEWAGLENDWATGKENEEAGLEIHPYHPLLSFTYDGETVTDAVIRVRGNPDWWGGPKMQFQISFNELDRARRFRGLRKLVLDSAEQNKSFLRDRMALWVLRHIEGVPAPCANNARLVVNGSFYGLYTNIEKADREFLERNFADPDGNLYKREGWVLETNEETGDTSRVALLIAARDIPSIDALMNLDEALLEWAGEAVIADADGTWAGGKNMYLYDDPLAGFTYIPWDLDATFTRLPYDVDPYTWHKNEPWVGRPYYDIVLADPVWFGRYLDAIDAALGAFDVATLQANMDAWREQIDLAVQEDPTRPFTYTQFDTAFDSMRSWIQNRHTFVTQWLECQRAGGTTCP